MQDCEVRMTQPRFLNDPHELSVEINPTSVVRNFYSFMIAHGADPKEAADIATRDICSRVIEAVERVKKEREKVGVLSLCDTEQNMLLWAHYADEHRGAVIELDVSEIATPISDPKEIQCLAEVIYGDKRIDFIKENIPSWLTLAFKSSVWSYEREWRFLKSLDNLKKKNENVFVLELPAASIKSVIFGARAVGQDEEAAIRLVQNSSRFKHVVIKKAVFTSELVGLELRTGESFAGLILHGQHHFGENWREVRQWVDLDKLEVAEKAKDQVRGVTA